MWWQWNCDGERQAGPQFEVVMPGVLHLFILKGPAPMAQNYPFMLQCTPGSVVSLGNCLYPGLPPDQHLEMLRGCSSSTAFSMMQAVCPLGRGHQWLAGPAQCACPLPPAGTSSAHFWEGDQQLARCLLKLLSFAWHRLGKAVMLGPILTLLLTSSVASWQVT